MIGSEDAPDQGKSMPRSPHSLITSTMSHTPLKYASPNISPTNLLQTPGASPDLRQRVFELVTKRIQDELQDLINKKAQTLGRSAVQVQFNPIAVKDKDRIHKQVFAQGDSSLRETAESTGSFLVDLWATRAKRLIREYKKDMDGDLVQDARSRARRATEAALRDVKNLGAIIPTPREEQHAKTMLQKTPDQPPPDSRLKNTTASATATLERQPGSRYNLRTRPTPKEEQIESQSEGRFSSDVDVDVDVDANPLGSPTPVPKLQSAHRTEGRQRNPPPVAAVREGIRKLSIEDPGALHLLSRTLIESLDHHLSAVDELINKELRSAGGLAYLTASIRNELITRNVAKSFISFAQNDLFLRVSSICADILLDWVSNRGDAIDLLEHERPKLIVQEALLAVERAKGDFYRQLGQLGFVPSQIHTRGAPKKQKSKSGSSTNVEVKATASTTKPKGSIVSRESTILEESPLLIQVRCGLR